MGSGESGKERGERGEGRLYLCFAGEEGALKTMFSKKQDQNKR